MAFELTLSEFLVLAGSDCHYCGIPPCQEHTGGNPGYNGAFVHNGIDRADNSLGYTSVNSVPCCSECNYAKARRPYTDFVAWLDRVAAHRKSIITVGDQVIGVTDQRAQAVVPCSAVLVHAAPADDLPCALLAGHSWSHEATRGHVTYRWGDRGAQLDPVTGNLR